MLLATIAPAQYDTELQSPTTLGKTNVKNVLDIRLWVMAQCANHLPNKYGHLNSTYIKVVGSNIYNSTGFTGRWEAEENPLKLEGFRVVWYTQ